MDKDAIIERTAGYVQDELCMDSSGHDWWHVHRVRELALWIGERESADLYVVELAALLHDISDYKLNGGDREEGPRIAFEWLTGLGESNECAATVADIVANSSFSARTSGAVKTIECKVVQDADRLDALGAIGVARAFAYGGYVGQPIYDSVQRRRLDPIREERLRERGSTIGHFYEKLLLLKDQMNTESARLIAERRHGVLERFLDEFLIEWSSVDVERALRRA